MINYIVIYLICITTYLIHTTYKEYNIKTQKNYMTMDDAIYHWAVITGILLIFNTIFFICSLFLHDAYKKPFDFLIWFNLFLC